MFTISIKRLSLLLVTLMSAAVITGCADMGQYNVYRTYYKDSDCRVFYINNLGQRVYVGVYTSRAYAGKLVVSYKDAGSGYYSNNAWHFYPNHTCR